MPFKNPHPLYHIWQGIKRRCNNPSSKAYPNYGGRGIKVCDRWLNSFQNFLDDMGVRPDGYSIERRDNEKGYTPENCHWAPWREQMRNQRRTRYVFIEGKTYKAVELAERSGLKTDTIVIRAGMGLAMSEVLCSRRRADGNWKKAVAKRVANQLGATHCSAGHEWSAENTRLTPQGWRVCRKCHYAKTRRQYLAKKSVLP